MLVRDATFVDVVATGTIRLRLDNTAVPYWLIPSVLGSETQSIASCQYATSGFKDTQVTSSHVVDQRGPDEAPRLRYVITITIMPRAVHAAVRIQFVETSF